MRTFLLFAIACMPVFGLSQATFVLQPGPATGKDAVIWSLLPSNNYGQHPDFLAYGWTWHGQETVIRSFIDFDLSGLPQGEELMYATLSLFHNHESANAGHAGDNVAVIKAITGSWVEDSLTWFNQPAVSDDEAVILPASLTADQDYLHIDVTDLVRTMYAAPEAYHGFRISMAIERAYRSMKFCSSDFMADSTRRPRLEITLRVPPAEDTTSTPRPPMTITPNPFDDQLLIRHLDGPYSVTIWDVLGRAVYTVSPIHLVFEGTPILPPPGPPGLFTVVVEGQGERYVEKLVRP